MDSLVKVSIFRLHDTYLLWQDHKNSLYQIYPKLIAISNSTRLVTNSRPEGLRAKPEGRSLRGKMLINPQVQFIIACACASACLISVAIVFM